MENTCAKPSDSGGDPSSDPLYVFNHRLEKTTEVVPAEERVTKQALEVRVALLRVKLHAPPKREPFLVVSLRIMIRGAAVRAGHQDNAKLMKLNGGHLLAAVLRAVGFPKAQEEVFPSKTGGAEKAKCAAAAAQRAAPRASNVPCSSHGPRLTGLRDRSLTPLVRRAQACAPPGRAQGHAAATWRGRSEDGRRDAAQCPAADGFGRGRRCSAKRKTINELL